MKRLVLALLVVVALGACSDDADDYQEDFSSVGRGLAALGADVGAGLRGAGGASDAALAQRFSGYARRLGELRGMLAKLDPPGAVAAAHDRLLALTASERQYLLAIRDAARAGDPAAARRAATGAVRTGVQLDRARVRLAKRVREL